MTNDNPADLFTKGMGRDRVMHLMQHLYFQLQGGRSLIAPVRDCTAPLMSPAEIDVKGDEFDSDGDGQAESDWLMWFLYVAIAVFVVIMPMVGQNGKLISQKWSNLEK